MTNLQRVGKLSSLLTIDSTLQSSQQLANAGTAEPAETADLCTQLYKGKE